MRPPGERVDLPLFRWDGMPAIDRARQQQSCTRSGATLRISADGCRGAPLLRSIGVIDAW